MFLPKFIIISAVQEAVNEGITVDAGGRGCGDQQRQRHNYSEEGGGGGRLHCLNLSGTHCTQ